MNELLPWSLLVAAALVGATVGWWRQRAFARQQHRRDEGWRLIHELKAHGAWLEWLRGEYAAASDSDEEAVAAAKALRSAGTLVKLEFPELTQAFARMVQGDGRLVTLLWQRRQHRAEQAAGRPPAQPAPGYRDLLEDQLDLVEELIARCQVLIGARDAEWHGTDIDAEFSPSFSVGTTPLR